MILIQGKGRILGVMVTLILGQRLVRLLEGYMEIQYAGETSIMLPLVRDASQRMIKCPSREHGDDLPLFESPAEKGD